jgi:hypothetical protein
MTDFSKTLIRASSVYNIMSNGKEGGKTPYEKWKDAVSLIPQLEARYESFKNKDCKSALDTLDKIEQTRLSAAELEKTKNDELPLSEGAKTFLAKLYAAEKYGKWSNFKDRGNKYTSKGKSVEEEAITMISRLDRILYVKNEERINNDFISGVPDILVGNSYDSIRYVIDIKSPYDIETFICNLGKPLNLQYDWQIQSYIWLTGAEKGEVSYCLVDTPDYLLQSEARRLFDRIGCVTEDDPEYLEALDQLNRNLTFGDMPIQDRRLKFIVERDEDKHQKIAKRVEQSRLYLQEIEKLHLDAIEFAQFQEQIEQIA